MTLDFHALIVNLQSGRRDAAEEQVADAVAALKGAGADFVVVTSGTTSTLTGLARQRTAIAFLDLATACFRPAAPAGPTGLLSTSHAASGGLFHAAAHRTGVQLIVPPPEVAAEIDCVIFGELVNGAVAAAGLAVFRDAIAGLVKAGAASIILGNTDLTLIAEDLQRTSRVPLIDSARAHARGAARVALTGNL